MKQQNSPMRRGDTCSEATRVTSTLRTIFFFFFQSHRGAGTTNLGFCWLLTWSALVSTICSALRIYRIPVSLDLHECGLGRSMGQLLHQRKWSHDELQWVQRVESSDPGFRVPCKTWLSTVSWELEWSWAENTILHHDFGIFFLAVISPDLKEQGPLYKSQSSDLNLHSLSAY